MHKLSKINFLYFCSLYVSPFILPPCLLPPSTMSSPLSHSYFSSLIVPSSSMYVSFIASLLFLPFSSFTLSPASSYVGSIFLSQSFLHPSLLLRCLLSPCLIYFTLLYFLLFSFLLVSHWFLPPCLLLPCLWGFVKVKHVQHKLILHTHIYGLKLWS